MSIILLTLFSLGCKSAKKEQLPTAKEVVEKYIEAVGSLQTIKAVKSLRIESIMAVPNVSYAETIYLYQPGKTCLIIKYPNGSVSKTIYNNDRAIEVVNGEPTAIKDSLQLERMKLFSHLQAEVGYFDENYKLVFVNAEEIKGRLNYRIKITSPLGATDYKLYDAKTGLLTLLADSRGYKTTYSDYESRDGMVFPTMQQSIGKTGRVVNIQVKKRVVNEPIDPKTFDF